MIGTWIKEVADGIFPKFDPSRRGFLSGLMASAVVAPYVLRNGLLVPDRSLLVPYVVSYLEASLDGERWDRIVRAVHRKDRMLRAADFPTDVKYTQFRIVMDREWKRAPSAVIRLGYKDGWEPTSQPSRRYEMKAVS